MKRIIPVFTTLGMVVPLVLFAQSAGEATIGESTAQNPNQAVQIAASGQLGNNQNRQAVAAQQNQISSGTAVLGHGGGIGRFGASYGYRLHNAVSRYPGMGETPLVVRSSDQNAKDEANLEEDLAVMAHIFDKALEDLPSGQAHTRTAMGIDVFVTPNSGAIRSIYLEGYGALFLLNVGFPVVAPTPSAPEEKPSGDSTWEEARQELYGQPGKPQMVTQPGEEFSEEKVTRLKEALLRALKNATNIRGLEGRVSVCVLGGANTIPANTATLFGRRSGGGAGVAVGQLLVPSGEAAASHGTVLTIKVTKADVDAFAKGELKFSDFQQRAQIAVYTTTASASNTLGIDAFSGALAK